MTITLDTWQLVSLLITCCGGFWALAKMLLNGAKQSIDEKFKLMGEATRAVQEHMKNQDDSSRRLERDLMELKAELPRDYVRREDYTQAIATITVKIDSMMLRMEAMFREVLTKGGTKETSNER